MLKLVTFTRWSQDLRSRTPISINPDEISDIEDYCGSICPGSAITLKNKKNYLVMGTHDEIVAKLISKEDSVG